MPFPLPLPLPCGAGTSGPSMVRGVEAGEVPGGVRLREAALLGREGGGRLARNSASAGLGGGTEKDLGSGAELGMEA